MNTVTLITDGSCDNRVGSGGWAAIVRTSTTLTELVGCADGTTSNRMELMAIIEGLRAIKTPSRVEIVADSAYALNAIREKWYERWIKQAETQHWLRDDKASMNKHRPNLDMWYQLRGLCEFHDVVPIKVKGHSGDYWNTRADRLADQARREKLSYTTEIPNPQEIRCQTKSPSNIQCKLHSQHSGECFWSNGKANGVEPYGTNEVAAISA